MRKLLPPLLKGKYMALRLADQIFPQSKKYHIALCVPNTDNVISETLGTAMMMAYHIGKNGHKLTSLTINSPLIDANRNICMKKTKEKSCDFLFFLDSDTDYEGNDDIIGRMISYGKDVVMGLTHLNRSPYPPNIYKWTLAGKVDEWCDPIPDRLFQVEAAGNGFQLISKKVIDAFTPEVIEEIGEPFEPIYEGRHIRLREDLAFCWRLKELGFEIWADPNIPIIHQKKYPISRAFYNVARASTNMKRMEV